MGHSAAVWDTRLALETTKDWNGIEQIILRNPQGASARVSLYGGQVISWRNERGEELLFTSSKGILKPPKAMRGGIPICFPQFGNCDSLEQHGFARNKMWTVDDDPPPLPPNDSHGKSFVDLLLKPSDEDLKFWPHRVNYINGPYRLLGIEDLVLNAKPFTGWSLLSRFHYGSHPPPHNETLKVGNKSAKSIESRDQTRKSFEFRLRVSVGMDGNLSLISRIRNVNGKPFSFSFAYHSYLSVSDISEVRIEGLETMDYLDNLVKRERFTEQGDAITFESEIDRVYLSSPNCVAVLDHEKKRTYVIRKEGLPDVVVWNPWDKKSKAMSDFGDEEYKQMLCVDGAAIEKPITLKPGEEWTGRLEIAVVPSSFCSEDL